jgi:hypothetical protein
VDTVTPDGPIVFEFKLLTKSTADGSSFLTVQYPIANSRHVGMASIGNRIFREEGVIRLVLSARRGRGQSQALQWCDALNVIQSATVRRRHLSRAEPADR